MTSSSTKGATRSPARQASDTAKAMKTVADEDGDIEDVAAREHLGQA